MKVQVRKCRFTGKIFEESKINDYVKHLKKVRDGQRMDRYMSKIRDEFVGWITAEKAGITHIDMIVPWFLKNQRYLMNASNANVNVDRGFTHRHKFYDSDHFTFLKMTNARFSKLTSNTHSFPKNGVQNFTCGDDSPKGYPGWCVHIEGSLSRLPINNSEYPYSNALNFIDICTGCGGGGNKSWSYDCKIFLDDWSGLQQQMFEEESDKMISVIKGKNEN